MFNLRTNISTTRVMNQPSDYYLGSLDWPLSMRLYPSMCPLYVNAEGFALSILVSRGYFPQLDYHFSGTVDLLSITLSWNWTTTVMLYDIFISYSTLHSQEGQNFSAYPDYYNSVNSFQYGSSLDNPNLSTSQIILIVIFSTLLPWLIYGAVRCRKAQNKKKSVGNEYFDSNIPIQITDKNKNKNKNKKKKGKQEMKKSARTKSKAWGIASWKRNRKRESGVGPEAGGSSAPPSDRANRAEDSEEDGLAQGSEEPPGSKICESEETPAFTTATEFNLGTPAATALGVTAMHGGLEDSRPIPFPRLNTSRVSDSGNSSSNSTPLGGDQPLGPVDQTEVGRRFTSLTEFIPLARHRLWSVVTSLSNQSSLPQHQRPEQQHQSSLAFVPATTSAASSTPSASEAHLALTGITIESTRPLPLLTGISAAPLISIPMSVISPSEPSLQTNQPRWARANSTPRAPLSISTIRTTDPSSSSPPASPILALPSAPPLP